MPDFTKGHMMTNNNPPRGVYPRKHRRGLCPKCNVDAFRTPFFKEKSLPGYKFRLCWCNICGDKWTEGRKTRS